MCTSFAVYNSRPFYGMNFDFPEVELKFRLASAASGTVFYLCFGWEDVYHEVAGLNDAGLFASAQILVAHFEIVPQPTDILVSPYEVFSHSLQTGRCVEDVLRILGPRRLGYDTHRKGHQLYADRFGAACILEPDRAANLVYLSESPFTIMANRPIHKELDRLDSNDIRNGRDRFQIAHRLIQERGGPRFGVEDGFEVLRQAALARGRFTTQSSMVCDPLSGEIYLTLKRDFSKIWKVSLPERTVETFSGFREGRKLTLDDVGVTGSELKEQNSVYAY